MDSISLAPSILSRSPPEWGPVFQDMYPQPQQWIGNVQSLSKSLKTTPDPFLISMYRQGVPSCKPPFTMGWSRVCPKRGTPKIQCFGKSICLFQLP